MQCGHWHLRHYGLFDFYFKNLDEDDRTEILSPNIRYFVAILRFVVIYALFGNFLAKKVPFWVKNSVPCARSVLLHGIYCILY